MTDPAAMLDAAAADLRAGKVEMPEDVALALAELLGLAVDHARHQGYSCWSCQTSALAVARAILGPGWATP